MHLHTGRYSVLEAEAIATATKPSENVRQTRTGVTRRSHGGILLVSRVRNPPPHCPRGLVFCFFQRTNTHQNPRKGERGGSYRTREPICRCRQKSREVPQVWVVADCVRREHGGKGYLVCARLGSSGCFHQQAHTGYALETLSLSPQSSTMHAVHLAARSLVCGVEI